MSDQLKGTLITLLGVLILSPDSTLVRLVSIDIASMTFWRGLGLGLVLLALSAAKRRGRVVAHLVQTGATGAWLVAVLMVSQVGFVAAITLTNPAHVLILISAAPLFGALSSRWLLGEPIPLATAIAIVAGLAGVAITASAGLAGEGADWRGDCAALVTAAAMGTSFTLMRKTGTSDGWTHFATAAGINVVLIALLFDVTLPAGMRLIWLALLVIVVLPGAFALITIGPRYIPSAEVALIMLLEAPVGGVIVWAVLGLVPTRHALLGGAVLIGTLAAHAWWQLGKRRPAQKSVASPLTSQSP